MGPALKIVVVSVADGSMRVVHRLPNRRYGWRASLSPDDRYLVYHGPVEPEDENFDIWLLPLAGGEPVRLIRHPAKDYLLSWVPGIDKILFLSDRDSTWDLWAAAVGDGATSQATARHGRGEARGIQRRWVLLPQRVHALAHDEHRSVRSRRVFV